MIRSIKMAWGGEVLFIIGAGLVASINLYNTLKDMAGGILFLFLAFVVLPILVGSVGFSRIKQEKTIIGEHSGKSAVYATAYLVIAYLFVVVIEYMLLF